MNRREEGKRGREGREGARKEGREGGREKGRKEGRRRGRVRGRVRGGWREEGREVKVQEFISCLPTTSLCSTVVLAPVIGGAVLVTLIPLVFATILAYCITGYIRDVLFQSHVKSCIGPSCNVWVSLTEQESLPP